MRLYLTGGNGFVGSNVARVFGERHGAEVIAPSHADVDLVDPAAVARSVAAARPDAIVHCAILNDLRRLYTHRREAWAAYVGATRNLVATGVPVVLVSTDWVFDGTQSGAAEDEPPNPVNAYGFLKAASELVVDARGAVARIAGVQGVHWARPQTPRLQDAGFGYLAASIVDALRAGRRFTVWEDPALNSIATPTLASDAAEMMWRIASAGLSGTFHCCGGEAVDRATLARRTVEVFELDASLLDVGPPEPGAVPSVPVPYDTSLEGSATAAALDFELPDVRTILRRLRDQIDTGSLGRDPSGNGDGPAHAGPSPPA
jgi:dTDP-4-dehydrorhamnose reductase